jgi:hypothetical protein
VRRHHAGFDRLDALGLAGALVIEQNVQAILWAIDAAGIVMASAEIGPLLSSSTTGHLQSVLSGK